MKQTDLINEILDEIRKFSEDQEYFRSEAKDYIPGMIPSGKEGGYLVSRKASRLLLDLTKSIVSNSHDFKMRYTLKDASRVVNKCLGHAITEENSSKSKSIEQIFRSNINETLSNKINDGIEYCFLFNCSFFEIETLEKHKMGMVEFVRTSVWLKEMLDAQSTNPKLKSILESAMSGVPIRAEQDFELKYISDFLNKSEWLCIVKVNGLSSNFALQNAILAANNSLLGLSLIWRKPSKIVSGVYLYYDTKFFHQEYRIVYVGNEHFTGGSKYSQLPSGQRVEIAEWDTALTQNGFILEIVKLVTEFILAPFRTTKSSKILETFSLALMWFREACRENNDKIAIVKFVACMDTMANGGNEAGIRELFHNRMGYTDSIQATIGGEKIGDVIKRLYRDGRSQIIHGTTKGFFNDFESDRNLAEILARYCLVLCMDWYSKNPTCDDPKQFRKSQNEKGNHQAASSN